MGQTFPGPKESVLINKVSSFLDTHLPYVLGRNIYLQADDQYSLIKLFFLPPVPTAVLNLLLSDNTTNILVMWEEPAEPNGNINYVVSIMCETLHDGVIFHNATVETLARELAAPREPFSECEVTVTPQTGAGMGPSSMDTIRTPEEGERCSIFFKLLNTEKFLTELPLNVLYYCETGLRGRFYPRNKLLSWSKGALP